MLPHRIRANRIRPILALPCPTPLVSHHDHNRTSQPGRRALPAAQGLPPRGDPRRRPRRAVDRRPRPSPRHPRRKSDHPARQDRNRTPPPATPPATPLDSTRCGGARVHHRDRLHTRNPVPGGPDGPCYSVCKEGTEWQGPHHVCYSETAPETGRVGQMYNREGPSR